MYITPRYPKWVAISTVLSKLKDFSRSQTVTYTVDIVNSDVLETVQYTDVVTPVFRWDTTAAIPMTLSDFQGHSPIASFSDGIFHIVVQQ